MAVHAGHQVERMARDQGSEFSSTRHLDPSSATWVTVSENLAGAWGGSMSRVLLVGKGAPDRGGIPTFLEELRSGDVGRHHDVTFLNVAHAGTPEGGEVTVGNVVRTLRDTLAVWRQSRGQDVVHINSAVAPTVTAIRAGLLALAGRLRGCAVVMHVHGGNLSTWLDRPPYPLVLRFA